MLQRALLLSSQLTIYVDKKSKYWAGKVHAGSDVPLELIIH